MNQRSWKGALVSVVVTEALGFLSGLLSGDTRGMYQALVHPPLSPPGWLFGVVWPVLYALLGLAVWRVWTSQAPRGERRAALELYGVQLALNLIWPVIFFRFGLLWAAVAVILALDVLVVLTIRSFARVDRLAAGLLVPYLLWILFATWLNIGFAVLN